MKKALSVCIAVLLTVFAAFPAAADVIYLYPSDTLPQDSLRVTAHRGLSELAPENTLPAYRLAGEYGFWGAECDISQTADGVWVLMHDATVDRMTDGEGLVSDYTYEAISALTVDAGNGIEQYPGTRVPTLTEYLDVCKEYGLHPVIEIKEIVDVNSLPDLTALLGAREEKDGFVVISWGRELIAGIKALLPETPCYLIGGPGTADDVDFCVANGIDGLDTSYNVSADVVGYAQEKGLKLMAWTVDTVTWIERMAELGVTDITTNCLVPGTAPAEPPSEPTALSAFTVTVEGQTILPTEKDGDVYFLLPACADLGAVELRFTPENASVFTGETPLASGGEVDVRSLASYDAASGVYSLPLCLNRGTEAQRDVSLRFMRSENVGAMFISIADSAYGRAWIDGSPNHTNDAGAETDVQMKLVSAQKKVIYDGALTSMKGRGNTTWASSAKKPYQIKLDKKTDLLDSGNKDNKNKTWVLLANALDKTMLKSAFAMDLARQLGLQETPEYTYADLYIDGEYRGLYQLTEKVQINSGRVDIAELEEHNTVGDETAAATGVNSWGLEYQYNPTARCDTGEIGGGYLLEVDGAFYRSENSWFKAYNGSVVVVKSPECCTKEQIVYISELFNEAMKAAENDVYNGKTALDYFDIDSLGAIYAVNEYTKNIDYTFSSTYFFLPEAGNGTYAHRFYAGPAWDFDTSMANRTENDSLRDPTGLQKTGFALFKGSLLRSAMQHHAHRIDALYPVIFSEEPRTEGSVSSFSRYRANIEKAARMNFTLWPFDNTPNTFAFPTYDENYTYTRDFLLQRHADIFPRIAAWETPDYAGLQNCIRGEHSVIDLSVSPTCTKSGQTGSRCEFCGKTFASMETLPALGHVDANDDKICDRCGQSTVSGFAAFLNRIRNFFARIIRFFRNLF